MTGVKDNLWFKSGYDLAEKWGMARTSRGSGHSRQVPI
jgi:hypothetical protein